LQALHRTKVAPPSLRQTQPAGSLTKSPLRSVVATAAHLKQRHSYSLPIGSILFSPVDFLAAFQGFFATQAAARKRFVLHEHSPRGDFTFAAFAQAKPSRLTLCVSNEAKNFKPAKNKAHHIH
jgi:hypothetical protein